MSHSEIVGKAELSGITVKNHSEVGEIVLEQHRVCASPSQVWIKANPEAVDELVSLLHQCVVILGRISPVTEASKKEAMQKNEL